MRRILFAAALSVMLVSPAVADDYHYLSTSEMGLSIADVKVGESHLVCINTGKQVKFKDGSTNALYTRRKPAEGNVFVTVTLQVVNEGCEVTRIDRQSIRITNPSGDGNPWHPIAWFDGPDWRAMDDSVPVYGKAELEFAFEVPAREADRLMLRVQDLALGAVGSFRDEAGPAGIMAR